MEDNKKSVIVFYLMRIVPALILVALFVLPFGMTSMNLLVPDEPCALMYPVKVMFLDTSLVQNQFLGISCYFLLLLPATAVFLIVLIFLKRQYKRTAYFLVLASLTVHLLCTVTGMVVYANTARWFATLSAAVYISFFISLMSHIAVVVFGIISVKTNNQDYSEYRKLCQEEALKETEMHEREMERIKREKERTKGDAERTQRIEQKERESLKHFKEKRHRLHLKTKIIIVMLATITIILFTFICIDLRNYRTLLTQTVNNTGGNQAEQVAAIYNFSDGLSAKINSFIEGLKRTNSSSPFPCERTDIITTNSSTAVYLEKIDSTTEFPEFNVFSYTTATGRVREIPAEEKRITPEQAALYIAMYQDEANRKKPVYNDDGGMCRYTYPITFQRKDGSRLVGFSVVTYRTEILERPYFQAKVFVFSVSATFLYISIIITLFLADFIANPIIFLCGSVRRTANILSGLLSGGAKMDPSVLVFDEKVGTKDEIKDLSVEIGNIVNIVRGVLPYISFHTLQNAERNNNRISFTRDLCFLFTDIRGFTTLCEGLPPREIIPILNRYLDIETQIILNNGGDVDKFVGDEMMAFFSGPRKEMNACKAAMEIRKAMWEAQQESIESGKEPISIGIGINSGNVVFGPVGSQTRKDFTSIGDTVNLAARLEGANKEYGSKSIITEAVYAHVKDSFVCRELDFITVKGKTEPVRIFEILQSTKIASDKLYDIKKLFETGLAYYRRMQWDKATEYFSECNRKYDDEPSRVFLRRIIHYKISPPERNWKGVFVMNVK